MTNEQRFDMGDRGASTRSSAANARIAGRDRSEFAGRRVYDVRSRG